MQAPEGLPAQQFMDRHEHEVNTLVYDAVCAVGGSISAEHGVGALKREELARRKSPVALQMMRAIKQALDPHGRLNPWARVVASDAWSQPATQDAGAGVGRLDGA